METSSRTSFKNSLSSLRSEQKKLEGKREHERWNSLVWSLAIEQTQKYGCFLPRGQHVDHRGDVNFCSESLKKKMSAGLSTSPSRGARLLPWCSAFLPFLLQGRPRGQWERGESFFTNHFSKALNLSQGGYTTYRMIPFISYS